MNEEKDNEILSEEEKDGSVEPDLSVSGDFDGDDVLFEEVGSEDGFSESKGQDVVKKLRERLKKCEEEKKEYLDGWQRAKADLINARKDDEKKMAEFRKFSNATLLNDIMQFLDGFDRAFAGEQWEKVDKVWRDGIIFLYKQLLGILKDYGVEVIDSIGKKFSPIEHEAIEEVEIDDDEKDGVVVEELRKGYKIHNKIIRPAQVRVGKFK